MIQKHISSLGAAAMPRERLGETERDGSVHGEVGGPGENSGLGTMSEPALPDSCFVALGNGPSLRACTCSAVKWPLQLLRGRRVRLGCHRTSRWVFPPKAPSKLLSLSVVPEYRGATFGIVFQKEPGPGEAGGEAGGRMPSCRCKREHNGCQDRITT